MKFVLFLMGIQNKVTRRLFHRCYYSCDIFIYKSAHKCESRRQGNCVECHSRNVFVVYQIGIKFYCAIPRFFFVIRYVVKWLHILLSSWFQLQKCLVCLDTKDLFVAKLAGKLNQDPCEEIISHLLFCKRSYYNRLFDVIEL